MFSDDLRKLDDEKRGLIKEYCQRLTKTKALEREALMNMDAREDDREGGHLIGVGGNGSASPGGVGPEEEEVENGGIMFAPSQW